MTGIIIPLSQQAFHNIIHHRNLYAGEKCPDWDLVEEGDRVFLYDLESRLLEGEAKIRRIALQDGEQLLKQLDRLCLTEVEIRSYAERTVHDKFLVIEVEEPVKYSNGITCPLQVPPGGLIVTDETRAEILRANDW